VFTLSILASILARDDERFAQGAFCPAQAFAVPVPEAIQIRLNIDCSLACGNLPGRNFHFGQFARKNLPSCGNSCRVQPGSFCPANFKKRSGAGDHPAPLSPLPQWFRKSYLNSDSTTCGA
jgi:hypothetical protein